MRNIRKIMLSLVVAVVGIIPITNSTASAQDAVFISEQSSGFESTPKPSFPTKWKYVSFKMGPSIDYWKKVAQCETGQNWKNGGYYSGGLGIAQSTWQGYGGTDFAPHPYEATVLQQVVVANRVAVLGYQTNEFLTLDDKLANKPFYRPAVGFTGWGCIKHNAYLKAKNNTVLKTRLPVGNQFYCPQFEQTFKKYALPSKVFSYIAWRESRCNPGSVNAIWKDGKITWTLNSNGSFDSGLLQINSCWLKTLKQETGYSPEDLLNPSVNAMFASWILHFTSGRLRNWNIYT